MGRRNKRKLTKLALLKCKKDMIIYGRIDAHETCYIKGKEYIFIVDEKEGELFNINELEEIYFFNTPRITEGEFGDWFTEEYFDIIKIGNPEEFDLDEFALFRLEKLNKERKSFVLN